MKIGFLQLGSDLNLFKSVIMGLKDMGILSKPSLAYSSPESEAQPAYHLEATWDNYDPTCCWTTHCRSNIFERVIIY